MQHGGTSFGPSSIPSNRLEPFLTLATKVVYLPVEGSNHVGGAIDGCSKLAALALPARDAVYLCGSSSLFRVDFVAELALLAEGNGLHDEFHAAGFSGSVLSVAVLSEVAPLPIAACESMLVEEAHVSRCPCRQAKLAFTTGRTGKGHLTATRLLSNQLLSVGLSEMYYPCVRGVETLPTSINLLPFGHRERLGPTRVSKGSRLIEVWHDELRHYLIEEDLSGS